MADLINMPRAAWKRQPSGVVRKNPSILEKWNVSEGIVCLPVQQTPVHLMSNTTIELVNTAYTNLVSTEGGYLYVFMEGITGAVRLLRMQTGSPNTRSFVFMTRFRINADLGGSVVLMRSGTTGTTSTLIPLWRSGTAFDMRVGGTDYTADGTFNVGQFYNLTIIGSETSCQLYVNNDLIINGSVAASATIDSNFCIGDVVGGALVSNTLEFQYILFLKKAFPFDTIRALHENPWQLFGTAPSSFYLIPSSGGSTTQTVSFSVDALIQRAGLTQSTSIDALLQSAFSRSLSLDSLIAAVQAETISLDALLQIVGTRTVSVDALVQAVKSGTVSVDALVQMTLTQAISLDALIIAASASSASTDLDAFIQALKTAGISLDALLSQSKTATAVIDALIQASKAGTVSLDAIITGASSTTVFVGLDALIQAIQAKTISLDALLQKSYTSPLALDAYVALTQVKTMSLDALLQSTKSGVISLDAILQMTKTAMVSFDALIQAAKTGVISLDAILVFATQASVLLDAYVQKTLARGVGLDAIIGAIADMILPTGRVITVPASDRFVFVTHSDRVIQIQ